MEELGLLSASTEETTNVELCFTFYHRIFDKDNYAEQIKGKDPDLYSGDTRLEWKMEYPVWLF
jgi:hypothetical protein